MFGFKIKASTDVDGNITGFDICAVGEFFFDHLNFKVKNILPDEVLHVDFKDGIDYETIEKFMTKHNQRLHVIELFLQMNNLLYFDERHKKQDGNIREQDDIQIASGGAAEDQEGATEHTEDTGRGAGEEEEGTSLGEAEAATSG